MAIKKIMTEMAITGFMLCISNNETIQNLMNININHTFLL